MTGRTSGGLTVRWLQDQKPLARLRPSRGDVGRLRTNSYWTIVAQPAPGMANFTSLPPTETV